MYLMHKNIFNSQIPGKELHFP